jgi:hypothetical protein
MASETEEGTAGWNTNLLIGVSTNRPSVYKPAAVSLEIARPMNNMTMINVLEI